MHIHGHPWSMDIHGCPWIFMGLHGYLWISMNILGYQWMPIDNRRYAWISTYIRSRLVWYLVWSGSVGTCILYRFDRTARGNLYIIRFTRCVLMMSVLRCSMFASMSIFAQSSQVSSDINEVGAGLSGFPSVRSLEQVAPLAIQGWCKCN